MGHASPIFNNRQPLSLNWICPKCQNVNWPLRTVCNTKGCNTRRPDGGSNGGIRQQPQFPYLSSAPLIRQRPQFSGIVTNTIGLTSVFNKTSPPGSWKCPSCDNLNWPHRKICNGTNCNYARPGRPNVTDSLQREINSNHV